MGDALLPDDLAQTVLVKPAFEVEDALKKLSSKEKIELLAGKSWLIWDSGIGSCITPFVDHTSSQVSTSGTPKPCHASTYHPFAALTAPMAFEAPVSSMALRPLASPVALRLHLPGTRSCLRELEN